MKNLKYTITLFIFLSIVSCKESQFADYYPNPSKLSSSSIERQYTGFQASNIDYVLPKYWNYFVVLRTTINHYNQVTGWVNSSGQYLPGSSGTSSVWSNYYTTLAQFRDFEKIYNEADAEEQSAKLIYLLSAKIYMYDYTQRMVDLFGTIPFSEAGKLSTYGGDYQKALAKFDSGESVYTLMLDDLKTIATQLNSINLNAAYQSAFSNQDLINRGDVDLWKRYCNSLRLRMLTRVSGAGAFTGRAESEIAEILGNSTSFPIVDNNDQNIQLNVYDVSTNIRADLNQAFTSGSGWYINTAGKAFIDQLKNSNDPRLPLLFQPGANAEGEYLGIDQLASGKEQGDLVDEGKCALFNRSMFDNNQYIPGALINAAEVSLLKAEYFLKKGNDASAKEAYEASIAQSIRQYESIRALSQNNNVEAPPIVTDEELAEFINGDNISWSSASSTADKTKLIAQQKWIHFNILQPYENWAENRRMDALGLSFEKDDSREETLPPHRWNIPTSEITYNLDNYNAIKSEDNLYNKLFWDIN